MGFGGAELVLVFFGFFFSFFVGVCWRLLVLFRFLSFFLRLVSTIFLLRVVMTDY